MSKLYWTPAIIDIQSEGCSTEEQENLLDSFERTMNSMSTTLVRKAYFELNDFDRAEERGIDDFSLELERGMQSKEHKSNGMGFIQNQAQGKTLTVLAVLEQV